MHERPYEKLLAWQRSHELCLLVYGMTNLLPSDERFRLVDQMCRSSQSIPTNIAEGNSRVSLKEKRHFFCIAQASLEELHYQSRLCKDLKYFSEDQYKKIDDTAQKASFLLTKLRNAF